MAKVYANVIIKKLKTINDVKESLREEVKAILIEMGYPELAE